MEAAGLAPPPHGRGGPPIWIGGMVRPSLERVGRLYDGWFPNSPDPGQWREQWGQIHQIARAAGRDPAALTAAVYLTLTIDDNKARAEERMNAFMENYYGRPAAEMRARQATYAGPADGAAAWVASWVEAGVSHLVLRFAGDHQQHLETVSRLRATIGGSWT